MLVFRVITTSNKLDVKFNEFCLQNQGFSGTIANLPENP